MDQSVTQTTRGGGRQVSAKDVANAKDYFEHFLNASSLKNILGYYRSICDLLNLKPNQFLHFYPKLKSHLTSWRAKALWKKFDARAAHKCYGKGKLCTNSRVLIIGGGPCGLRTAIEAQLLGAKVVVIEKRDRLSRNNVLHLWPFVIEDLRMLGAKKFFGKFCAGAIDHISIRQLQCILLKVALLLGVEVHTEVSFERLIEPNLAEGGEPSGWRAEFEPRDHPVSQYEFDVIIGADGKRNTLQGFKRKEFRGKLAIAITANFINKRTEAEARVQEISGVAFIFNQKFFKELHEATGIDLENIVYYKDDTHYFVMTAKKPSLIEKGVIRQDLTDTERLLAPDNVNREALMDYAREAANFSTNYEMLDLEFAVNHYGQPDVAMFDFTSMYAAENASKVVERHGFPLLMILVGDSLLEPFWPTGSGCARGFLSSMDAAWAIRSWNSGAVNLLDVLAERESIYRLLAQTTPDNLNKDWKAYTLDPATRYPNLNKNVVMTHQITALYDTDNAKNVDKMRKCVVATLPPISQLPRKRRRDNVDSQVLLSWVMDQVRQHDDIVVTDVASVFHNGKTLCAILERYRPDLLDFATKSDDAAKNNQLAIDILEKDIGISPVMTGEEITRTDDYLTMATYLTEIYDSFRCEIPHIKHPRLELPRPSETNNYKSMKFVPKMALAADPVTVRPPSRHNKRHADAMMGPGSGVVGAVSTIIGTTSSSVFNKNNNSSMERKTRKRRTFEKVGMSVDRENKAPSGNNGQSGGRTGGGAGNADDEFAARIKNMEDKWTEATPVDKKPKDLLRAIGKIETSDWNIKEIEKKIKENKLGKASSANRDKEKVPKWSKEQFLARQTKMEKQHLERQNSGEAKFADIDRSIKNLELKLKEGTTRELGTNKVATITEKLASKVPDKPEPVPIQKSQSRSAVILPTRVGGSEFCHFCGKRVYLMERLSAEGRFFHHGCFKCQYCHTQLRLGSYAFDRDGLYDNKFFCIHHYGMQGEVAVKTSGKVARKPSQRHANNNKANKAVAGKQLSGIAGVDLLDRVNTPERVEFANLSVANASSDHEESPSQMDEDEWTDKNFGASTAEFGSSDEESSSFSESDSDDEDAYEEALEEPATKEGTLKWAERFKKRYAKKQRNDSDSDDDYVNSSSDQSSYYEENTSDDDESDTATEGEEEIRQRELRKQEVRVEPPVVQTDTGTDTEVVSDESSDTSSEIRNSATEISTDSEFAHDDPTPTREIPSIVFNDVHVTKTRGSGAAARRIHVTSGYLQRPVNNGKSPPAPSDVRLNMTPLVPSNNNKPKTTKAIRPQALPSLVPTARNESNYALNRTQSTGGIAAKVSLELKKRYLLGGECGGAGGSIQKSGSASTLDTKFKSFHTNITDCQKMLKKNPTNLVDESVTKTIDKAVETMETVNQKVFENELEGRPRSPVHETSIIVPTIDWSKKCQQQERDQSEDSLSEDSFKDVIQIVPSVEVEEIPPDSLCLVEGVNLDSAPKSISSEKKTLNQPKTLPGLNLDDSLHHQHHRNHDDDVVFGVGNDDDDLTAAALTETELSDWARDGAVSSSDLDLYSDNCDRKAKVDDVLVVVAETTNPTILTRNLDHIEFMDVGVEENTTPTTTSSEEAPGNSQNGYVLFRNDEDDQPLDSLDHNINVSMVTPVSPAVNNKNTGYCVLFDGNNCGGDSIEALNVRSATTKSEQEDDSLVMVEGCGISTEENTTCSDSTVKNVTEIVRDDIGDFQRKRMEEKLAQLKAEVGVEKQDGGDEFDRHCQRLLSKRIEFGNVKDSIDVRKSTSFRRKSKPDLLIGEETGPVAVVTEVATPRTPDVLYNKAEIEKERDVNQRLVQEMVMSKLKAANKSLERKKRKNTSVMMISSTPTRQPYPLMKSATTDIVSDITPNNRLSTSSGGSSTYVTPDVILPTITKQTPDVFATPLTSSRPLSVFTTSSLATVAPQRHGDEFETPVAPPRVKHEEAKKTAEKLKRDARFRARLLSNEELGLSPEDKLRRLKERLNLAGKGSVGDVKNLDDFHWSINNDTLSRKRNGSLRRSKSGDTDAPAGCVKIEAAPPSTVRQLAAPSSGGDVGNICKSDPNLLDTDLGNAKKSPPTKKKSSTGKDRERRKSLTKFISTLFKKSPNSSSNVGTGGHTSKGLFSRKSKDVSKSCANLDSRDRQSVVLEEEAVTRTKSVQELRDRGGNSSPPPVPPLPLHYTGTASSTKCTDDSSDGGDVDWNRRSSCEIDSADHILTHKRSGRSNHSSGGGGGGVKRQVRQAQLKRHRMAQEIQRKLEETEVKTRELEERGVVVEKALRGEEKNVKFAKEEGELLQEWFDLMRDRTELRRYEKELMVRAQELELEDRHARLQHELREKLENDEHKTDEDVAIEGSIIKEMMEIVAKRDSLIGVLEEDRLRYSTEDRNFEEQMLAKGLILTPIRKSPEK